MSDDLKRLQDLFKEAWDKVNQPTFSREVLMQQLKKHFPAVKSGEVPRSQERY